MSALGLASSLMGGGGLNGGTSAATQGPQSSGPVVVNVAGFGSHASGSASAAASSVPSGQSSWGDTGALAGLPTVGGNMPGWLLPVGALALGLIVFAMLKGKR